MRAPETGSPQRILVANRGEIAIRIVRAARAQSHASLCIHAEDEADALHRHYAYDSRPLRGSGPAAYLDQSGIIDIALVTGCTAVHPGYGFLSENAAFARACAARGLIFIGPSAETLDLFGDKIAARALAQRLGVPVAAGTSGATTLEEARSFAATHGAVMLKAVAGGGGRGMRVVRDLEDLEAAYERCASEALKAFGNGDLYVEKLLPAARHIEVQLVGDGSGLVSHLWERDCSIQRRHQKLVEIAPAPLLDTSLRQRLIDAALTLGRHVAYKGVGTVEFLVAGQDFWFIEANPRLQVEHTITEEITGVDLVQTQMAIAFGASLADLDLTEPPPVRGTAIQARVNLEVMLPDGSAVPRAGRLLAYEPPSGPHVRVDGMGCRDYVTSTRYDPLLAKLIVRDRSFTGAAKATAQALREFKVEGVETNIPFITAILSHDTFLSGRFDTGFIAAHLDDLLSMAGSAAVPDRAEAEPDLDDTGTVALRAPMTGTIIQLSVAAGDRVHKGQGLLVVEAMKMEHPLSAPCAGTIAAVKAVPHGQVAEGAVLILLCPDAGDGDAGPGLPPDGEDWQAEIAEIGRRHAIARDMGGPDKVARQRNAGKLTARERIERFADPGSFSEIGALTALTSYDGEGHLRTIHPANFIAGTGRADGRKLVLGVDDFTLRAGSGDAAIHEKQVFIEHYAGEMRLPLVRLLDGASGGGSVTMALEQGFHYLPVNPGWDAVVENLSLIPVVAACLGPTVGLGAARLAMSHFSVMIEGLGQVFTAGPPIVRSATREDLTKEELGGATVHADNGLVERIVPDEQAAFDSIRRFLSYLPSSVFEPPPCLTPQDPCDRRDASLAAAIPRNDRRPYRIEPILRAIFDDGSLFRFAGYGGATVTALARLDGCPVGVLATDPEKGATMTAQGAMAITRLVDLCETFHLPIVSLTDQAGMSIGLAAERAGTIRFGARAIASIYQATVPQAEIILRRVFGVGGAGIVNRHRAGRSWAWPSARWGSIPQQGGIEAAFRAELDRAPDRAAAIAAIERRLEAIASPLRTAERFGVQDIIDPRQTRPLLCDWVRDAYRLLPERLGRPCFGTRP
ncbi:carboxyl transferase domain-containing protein [Niveispirillum sp.]|uniref:acetyl-CoA carboxylase family protein n=1 Tax=Niveispirillum sp. TaxID=1917217 RepID=UPI001B54C68A|nr:carboxyl transferase domain-containing protein [Niveispirillum sp.]MBP7337488.1 ATP-grasp domain-containing protein [Niveispirillum sp.]